MVAKKGKKIEVLTDFDGTLTDVPGGPLVNSPFYKSLFLKQPPDVPYDYQAQLLPIKELTQKIKAELFTGPKRDPRRISEGAVKFLQELLVEEKVGIAIISRNQTDYIKAMLLVEGFTEDQIEKIKIYDWHKAEQNNKKDAAHEYLKDIEDISHPVFIFDDSKSDTRGMQQAAERYSKEITAVSVPSQKFNWDENLSLVKNKVKEINQHSA